MAPVKKQSVPNPLPSRKKIIKSVTNELDYLQDRFERLTIRKSKTEKNWMLARLWLLCPTLAEVQLKAVLKFHNYHFLDTLGFLIKHNKCDTDYHLTVKEEKDTGNLIYIVSKTDKSKNTTENEVLQ